MTTGIPLLTLALLLAPADWPHLRGPNQDGVSTEKNLADTWPEAGPPRLWQRDLGQGHSGFIVADGRLYTQRQTLTSSYLLCLDPKTGQTLWETRLDWSWQPRGAYPGPYATPTWSRGKVHVTSPTGRVACVDGRTGEYLWSLNVREKFQGDGFGFGYAITPTLEAGRMILPVGGPDASLVALDPDSGKTLWASGSDPASYCPVLPITFADRRCVVGYLQNAWVIADAATGKQLFRQSLSAGYDEHSAWPLYREPHLLLTAPFHAPATRYELKADSAGVIQATPTWMSREFANDVTSSVLYRGHVYGFDVRQAQSSKHRATRGAFRCLDWATGKTCWSTDAVGQAGVVVADGKLYLLNDTGTLILADADPTAYRERGRVQLFDDEICWTPPTVCDGRLFARSPSKAVCLWVGKPKELPPDVEPLPPEPATRSWRFDLAWLVSQEREYPNDAPTWVEMTTWFAACLAILAVAAVVALPFRGRRLAIFLAVSFLLALLGPGVLSTWLDRLLFTWPLSLYAVFHATLWTCRWATRHPERRDAGWLARLVIVVLLFVSYGYVELCRSAGMFVAWAFLIGYPIAFLPTWLAVRAAMNHRLAWAATWTLVAFTIFFWSGQALLLWKAADGR